MLHQHPLSLYTEPPSPLFFFRQNHPQAPSRNPTRIMLTVREPVTWPRSWPGNPALGVILGTLWLCDRRRESSKGWGFVGEGAETGGDGGADSRLELRECCFRSASARVEWAPSLPRRWSRDWVGWFFFIFFVRRVVVGRALGWGSRCYIVVEPALGWAS